MKRHPVIILVLLSLAMVTGCGKKQTVNTYTHPRDGYTITIPEGWSQKLEDLSFFMVLTLQADSTKPADEQVEINVLSDNVRQPVSFESVARDAGVKMTIIRRSSQMFTMLDSSRIEVAGRTGIVYTFERVPNNVRADYTPRHVVMVFLQSNQGMINIKYIAPKPVAKQYAALFQENLNQFRVRDIGEPISKEEFEKWKQERFNYRNEGEKLKQPGRK